MPASRDNVFATVVDLCVLPGFAFVYRRYAGTLPGIFLFGWAEELCGVVPVLLRSAESAILGIPCWWHVAYGIVVHHSWLKKDTKITLGLGMQVSFLSHGAHPQYSRSHPSSSSP